MSRLADAVVPPRLGGSFRWLLASSWTTNLGDGIALAAGPLLVASMTGDAFVVALAATVHWLPPLLFGLAAGAVTDRLDRRLVVAGVDLARVVVLALLTLAIIGDQVSIVVVLAALFVLGTAEVFADNASQTLAPMLVARDDLALANSRLVTGFVTLNYLTGPPLGAALFTAGAAWAFGAQAVVVALGAVFITRVVLPATGRDHARRPHLRHDVGESLRWVARQAAVRTLVLSIFIFNITYGAAWSVLVLYAMQRLGLGEVGYGLVATANAAGGLVGTLCYGTITARVSLGDLMRIGLVIETLTPIFALLS